MSSLQQLLSHTKRTHWDIRWMTTDQVRILDNESLSECCAQLAAYIVPTPIGEKAKIDHDLLRAFADILLAKLLDGSLVPRPHVSAVLSVLVCYLTIHREIWHLPRVLEVIVRHPVAKTPTEQERASFDRGLFSTIWLQDPRFCLGDTEVLTECIQAKNAVPDSDIHGNYHSFFVYLLAKGCFFLFLRRILQEAEDFNAVRAVFDIMDASARLLNPSFREFMSEHLKPLSARGDIKALRVFLTVAKGTNNEHYFAEAYLNCLSSIIRTSSIDSLLRELPDMEQLVSSSPELKKIFLGELVNLLRIVGKDKRLLEPVRSLFASVKDSVNSTELFKKLENDLVALSCVFDMIADEVSASDLQSLIKPEFVTRDSASLLTKCLSMTEGVDNERVTDMLCKLLLVADDSVIVLIEKEILSQERFRKPILEAINRVNAGQEEFDIFAVCRLLSEIGVTDFEMEQIDERLFLAKDSVEIIKFVRTFPFVRISDTELLLEFCPHDDILFEILRSRFLGTLASMCDEIVDIESDSTSFYRLLVDEFHASKDLRFAFEALMRRKEGQTELVSEMQAIVNEKNESIASDVAWAIGRYGEKIIPLVRQLNVSGLKFDAAESEKNDVLSAFVLEQKLDEDRQELVDKLLLSKSAYAKAVALTKESQDVNVDDLFISGLENGDTFMLKRLGDAGYNVSDEKAVFQQLLSSDKDAAGVVFDRITNGKDKEYVMNNSKCLLESKNLSLVAPLFGNREIVDGFKSFIRKEHFSNDPTEFASFLESIHLPDDEIVCEIVRYFLSPEFPCLLRDPQRTGLLFNWMLKSQTAACGILTEFSNVSNRNSCEEAPVTGSHWAFLFSHINSIYATESEDVQSFLTKARFSSASTLSPVPSIFTRREFKSVLDSLSVASRKKFEIVYEKDLAMHDTLILDLVMYNGIVESLNKDGIVIRSHPDVLVIDISQRNDANFSIDYDVEINENMYELVGFVCRESSFVRSQGRWIQATASSFHVVEGLSERPSVVVYQKRNVMFKGRGLTEVDAFARCLRAQTIDWTVMKTADGDYSPEFLQIIFKLLDNWRAPELFEAFIDSQNFNDFFVTESSVFSSDAVNWYEPLLVKVITRGDVFIRTLTWALGCAEGASFMANVLFRVLAGPHLSIEQKLQIADEVLHQIPRDIKSPAYESFVESIVAEADLRESQSPTVQTLLEDALRMDNSRLTLKLLPLQPDFAQVFLDTCSSDFLPDILKRHLELKGDETVVLNAIRKFPDIESVALSLLSLKNYALLSSDCFWIKCISTFQRPEDRKAAYKLIENVWPPDSEPIFDVGNAIKTFIERASIHLRSTVFEEVYQLVSKYHKWFGNSQQMALVFLNNVDAWSDSSAFKGIVRTICELPAIADDKYWELLRKHLASGQPPPHMWWLWMMLGARSPASLAQLGGYGATEENWCQFCKMLTAEEINDMACLLAKSANRSNPVQPLWGLFLVVSRRHIILPYLGQILDPTANWKANDAWDVMKSVATLMMRFPRPDLEDHTLEEIEDIETEIFNTFTRFLKKLPVPDARLPVEKCQQNFVKCFRRHNWGVDYIRNAKSDKLKVAVLRLIRTVCRMSPHCCAGIGLFYCAHPPTAFGSTNHDFREKYSKFLVKVFKDTSSASLDTNHPGWVHWGSLLFKEGFRGIPCLPDLQYYSIKPIFDLAKDILADPNGRVAKGMMAFLGRAPEFWLLEQAVTRNEEEALEKYELLQRMIPPKVDLNLVDRLVMSIKPFEAQRIAFLQTVLSRSRQFSTNRAALIRSLSHIEYLIDNDENQTLKDCRDLLIQLLAAVNE